MENELFRKSILPFASLENPFLNIGQADAGTDWADRSLVTRSLREKREGRDITGTFAKRQFPQEARKAKRHTGFLPNSRWGAEESF